MLRSKQLQKYIDKREEKLLHYLRSYKKKKDQEDLHQFRVEVKKMNALFYLLKRYSNDLDISDELKAIKKLYDRAGLVRTAYLNIRMFRNNKQRDKKFFKEQNEQIKKHSEKFISEIPAFLKDHKATFKTIRKQQEVIKNKFILKFYKKELKKAEKLSFRTDKPDELHKCRKKIKRLNYIYDVLPQALAKKINLNTDYLKKLEDKIGTWHDSVLLSETLKKARSSDKETMERIRLQQKEQLKQLKILLNDFLNKVTLS